MSYPNAVATPEPEVVYIDNAVPSAMAVMATAGEMTPLQGEPVMSQQQSHQQEAHYEGRHVDRSIDR